MYECQFQFVGHNFNGTRYSKIIIKFVDQYHETIQYMYRL